MAIENIALNLLDYAPEQMRKGARKVDDLVASMTARVKEGRHPLQHNLTVYPVVESSGRKKAKDTGRFAVSAGERRRLALLALAEEGLIPADLPIPCDISSKETALADSTAENIIRLPAHPVDQYEAFAGMVAAGKSVADVALAFNTKPSEVEKYLKLAKLHPELLELYRQGEFDYEVAGALCICDDQEKQLAVCKAVPKYEHHRAHYIKRALTEGEPSVDTPLMKLVGMDAYLAAGGGVRRDLFSQHDSGFVMNPEVLQGLADGKIAAQVARIEAEGWLWVEYRDEHFSFGGHAQLYAEEREPSEEEAAAFDQASERVQALRAGAEPVEANELAKINAAITEMKAQRKVYPDEGKALAGAVVTLTSDGQFKVDRGAVRPSEAQAFKAMLSDAEGQAGEGEEGEGDKPRVRGYVPSTGSVAKAAAKRADGLSEKLVETLTAHRTMALRAEVMNNPAVAMIAAVHTLATRQFYSGHRVAVIWNEGEAHLNFEGVDTSSAAQAMSTRRNEIKASLPRAHAALWDHLTALPADDLARLLAYLVAQSVYYVELKGHEAMEHSGRRPPNLVVGAQLGAAVGLDMAKWWSADTWFFDKVSGAVTERAVSEACGETAAASLAGMKKAEKVEAAAQLVEGREWLPEVLRPQPLPEITEEVAAPRLRSPAGDEEEDGREDLSPDLEEDLEDEDGLTDFDELDEEFDHAA